MTDAEMLLKHPRACYPAQEQMTDEEFCEFMREAYARAARLQAAFKENTRYWKSRGIGVRALNAPHSAAADRAQQIRDDADWKRSHEPRRIV